MNDKWIDPRISIGNIMQIIVFIVMMAIAWSNLSNRQSLNDSQTIENTQAIKTLAEGQTKQNAILEKLILRLEDYPPHIHAGKDIIYPNGKSSDVQK